MRLYKPQDSTLKELRNLYRCLQNLKQQQTQMSNFLENKDCLPKTVQEVYGDLNKSIEQQITILNSAIDQLLLTREALNQDCQNLQSIPGIGKATAVALLAEMPDLSTLENARSWQLMLD